MNEHRRKVAHMYRLIPNMARYCACGAHWREHECPIGRFLDTLDRLELI